jgi:hypothetical protein
LGLNELQCKGVKGIDAPETFSQYVKTKDWTPINTQFKASNIKLMIERFGGEKLYGKNYFVPIRELIQNGIDATKAKKFHDKKFHGNIHINYSIVDNDEYLTIEDNGIGMTKLTILNFLLDFGKSYWSSNQMINDYPGLFSSGFSSTGKYGIGFFSTFMITDSIKIFTKSLKGNETIILEFINGIESPPIFRKPNKNEEMHSSGTKIILKLKKNSFLKKISEELNINFNNLDLDEVFYQLIENILPSSPIEITGQFNDTEEKILIKPNDWASIENSELLSRLTGLKDKISDYYKKEVDAISYNLSNVVINGELIGRATIIPKDEKFSFEKDELIKLDLIMKAEIDTNVYNPFKKIQEGILTVDGLYENCGFPIIGLWSAQNSKLDRLSADLSFTNSDIKDWIEEQSKLIISNPYIDDDRKLKSSALLMAYGSTNQDLPLLLHRGKMHTCKEFYDLCLSNDHIFLYNSTFASKNNFSQHICVVPTISGELHFGFLHNDNKENPYTKGFKGQLNLNTVYYFNSLINQNDYVFKNIYRSVFMRKAIEIICKSWEFKFGGEDILDLFSESFLEQPISSFISDSKVERLALIINPKKTKKIEVLEKYKDIVSQDHGGLMLKLLTHPKN